MHPYEVKEQQKVNEVKEQHTLLINSLEMLSKSIHSTRFELVQYFEHDGDKF